MLIRQNERETTAEEAVSMRKVQSLIRQWMSYFEEIEGWISVSPRIRHTVRRAIIRVAWSAYKIGLLTPFEQEDEIGS